MHKVFAVAVAVAVSFPALAASGANEAPPSWAWGFTTPADPNTPPSVPSGLPPTPAPPKDGSTHTLPGSKAAFTRAQLGDSYTIADWFPDEHPPMPEIVGHGRRSASPTIYGCGLCHMPDGRGRPENANLTGLPYDYIVRQLLDFKQGLRHTSDNRKTNTALMESFTRSMTDDEIKSAAAYFSAIPAPKWVSVVESTTVPKTRTNGGVFLTIEGEGAGKEPLGNRIVETPASTEGFEVLRSPHTPTVAYVPPGSVQKGKSLVTTGDHRVTACTVCHGEDLRGLGPVPRLAGRSPSYIGRQLYDMKHGNRAGAWSPLMAPVVDKLTNDDILVVAAYLASLDP